MNLFRGKEEKKREAADESCHKLQWIGVVEMYESGVSNQCPSSSWRSRGTWSWHRSTLRPLTHELQPVLAASTAGLFHLRSSLVACTRALPMGICSLDAICRFYSNSYSLSRASAEAFQVALNICGFTTVFVQHSSPDRRLLLRICT